MSVTIYRDWFLSERGKKDAERHRQLIDNMIRDNIKDIIAKAPIITGKNDKVKIVIKWLKDYYFKFADEDNEGLGSYSDDYEVNEGDNIKIFDKNKKKSKGTLDEEENNEDILTDDEFVTEIDLSYIISILGSEFDLPWMLEKKKKREIKLLEYEFDSIKKHGNYSDILKKRTIKESIKRTISYIYEIMNDTNCSEEEAVLALSQANGDICEAINIIKENKLDLSVDISQFFIDDDDYRFRKVDERFKYISNCVLFAVMDISGSMVDKKFLAKTFLFWLTQFLKSKYDNFDIVFVAHTDRAWIVDEESFFKLSDYGGTLTYTAFKLINELIVKDYPVDDWNIYIAYISDGEDFDIKKTLVEVRKLIDMKINMFSYCQININKIASNLLNEESLIEAFQEEFNLKEYYEGGMSYFINKDIHFIAGIISDKSHIVLMLKHIFSKGKE